MTEQEYRQAEGVNKSTLWELRKSPAHYQYILTHQREDTPALRIGRAIHSAVLTPTAYKREWTVIPADIDRRTKAGKEEYAAFMEQNKGKEILTSEEAETVMQIAKAIKRNKAVSELLKGTRREKPIFWTNDGGIPCKCRIDAMKTGIVIDLKTTTDASTDAFTREALKYGYDVQAAHYLDGYQTTQGGKMPKWYFIAVEKAEPYAINIIKAGLDFIDHGILRRNQLFQLLEECKETNRYPDYGTNEMIMPKWAEG